jgi:alkylation response protein AidB-like acyl-CoA dehydrogenase
MTYQPPVRDFVFLMKDVLKLEQYSNLKGFSEASMDVLEQIIEEAGKFSAEVLGPLNAVGDKEGCTWHPDHSVTTPKGFKEAYTQLVAGGWPGLGAEIAYGGQGLPYTLSLPFSEMSSSANMAFSMYPGLTHGAYSAILNGGSEAQKDLYLPRLASGEWGGTMNLTEPHCGTDLGLLRTKAVPQADGSYRITGQKIWISGGEHDMAENIVHLVLARIEGAPAGTRGISLFIVPKFIPDAENRPGVRNSVYCDGLEEKMGIHGNATCVIRHEESQGWLVGEENRGLSLMFVMMNEARVGVGLQGIAQGEAAYQAAASFAKDRLQGRSLTGPKNLEGPADPIIVHPDVRRMLMTSRALIEGGRAFLFWVALHGDLAHVHTDPDQRQKAHDIAALMTPVVKGYLTDKGLQVCSDALQIHGGSGFTEHFPASQYMRDVRIALIYEGTNGVQALDLVGRKLAADGGRAVMAFFAEMDSFIDAHAADEDLKPFVEGLASAKAQLQEGTMWLMQNGLMNPDNAGAASTDYMHLFGLTALTYMWARIAKTVLEKIAAGETDPFYANKLVVGRFFLQRVLPDAAAHLTKLTSGSDLMMALPAEAF